MTTLSNWLQNKNTIEFLGLWENLNNENFNYMEFQVVKNNIGANSFYMSVQRWNDLLNGKGIIAKEGRYGGTYAHKDIALEFCSWLSPEFKLYLIREFQKFKEIEAKSDKSEWSVRRILAKAQYKVHTDAVKAHLIPSNISKEQEGYIYANESDIINVSLFGMTAKQWKEINPNLKGNQRDYATIEQLVVLSSLESQNALLIQQGKSSNERLLLLNELAKNQMKSLLGSSTIKQLSDKPLLSDISKNNKQVMKD